MSKEERLQRIADLLAGFSEDELGVVEVIVTRLDMGARQYGRLKVAADPRDWTEEFRQEMADGAVYASIWMLANMPPNEPKK